MIGLDKDKLAIYASHEAAAAAAPTIHPDNIARWEPRYSGFADGWILAALSSEGYLLGYQLKE